MERVETTPAPTGRKLAGAYLLQLAGVIDFYRRGLFFTLRNAVRPQKAAAAAVLSARDCLAKHCEEHFSWLERSGLLLATYSGFETLAGMRGTILLANHPGLFDALLIYRRFPRAACVMRAGLRNNLCFRGFARECGFLPNDSGRAFLLGATSALRAGDNLLIFPEGTRTQPGTALNPFLRGFAHAALQTGAPVRTILVQQEGNYLRKGVSLFEPAAVPLRVRLSVGDEFRARSGERAGEFCERVRQWFVQKLGARID